VYKDIKIGIYRIINLKNNKIYIGSTSNLNLRLKSHFTKLKLNKHVNKYLQRAYNKYGTESFTYEIIEYVDSKNRKTILEREQYYLDLYKSYNKEIGYNIAKKAEGPYKEKLSEEHKKKISNTEKGVPKGPMSDKTKRRLSIAKIGCKHSEETKKKIGMSCRRKIINLDTNEIFDSIIDAANKHNLSTSFICNVCAGRKKKAGGHRWAHYYNKGENK
jgi:group I intron endonuclease